MGNFPRARSERRSSRFSRSSPPREPWSMARCPAVGSIKIELIEGSFKTLPSTFAVKVPSSPEPTSESRRCQGRIEVKHVNTTTIVLQTIDVKLEVAEYGMRWVPGLCLTAGCSLLLACSTRKEPSPRAVHRDAAVGPENASATVSSPAATAPRVVPSPAALPRSAMVELGRSAEQKRSSATCRPSQSRACRAAPVGAECSS
jgi:hypothetical protein